MPAFYSEAAEDIRRLVLLQDRLSSEASGMSEETASIIQKIDNTTTALAQELSGKGIDSSELEDARDEFIRAVHKAISGE